LPHVNNRETQLLRSLLVNTANGCPGVDQRKATLGLRDRLSLLRKRLRHVLFKAHSHGQNGTTLL